MSNGPTVDRKAAVIDRCSHHDQAKGRSCGVDGCAMALPRFAAAIFVLALAALCQAASVDPLPDDKVLQASLTQFLLRPQPAIDDIRAELAAGSNKEKFGRLSKCVTRYAANESEAAKRAAEIAEKVNKDLCLKHPSSCIDLSRQESLKQTFGAALIGVLGAELGGQPKADTSKDFKAYAREVAATWSVARMATPELLPIVEQVYFDASGQLATVILQTCAVPTEEKPPARSDWWIWVGVAAGAVLLLLVWRRWAK